MRGNYQPGLFNRIRSLRRPNLSTSYFVVEHEGPQVTAIFGPVDELDIMLAKSDPSVLWLYSPEEAAGIPFSTQWLTPVIESKEAVE